MLLHFVFTTESHGRAVSIISPSSRADFLWLGFTAKVLTASIFRMCLRKLSQYCLWLFPPLRKSIFVLKFCCSWLGVSLFLWKLVCYQSLGVFLKINIYKMQMAKPKCVWFVGDYLFGFVVALLFSLIWNHKELQMTRYPSTSMLYVQQQSVVVVWLFFNPLVSKK